MIDSRMKSKRFFVLEAGRKSTPFDLVISTNKNITSNTLSPPEIDLLSIPRDCLPCLLLERKAIFDLGVLLHPVLGGVQNRRVRVLRQLAALLAEVLVVFAGGHLQRGGDVCAGVVVSVRAPSPNVDDMVRLKRAVVLRALLLNAVRSTEPMIR